MFDIKVMTMEGKEIINSLKFGYLYFF